MTTKAKPTTKAPAKPRAKIEELLSAKIATVLEENATSPGTLGFAATFAVVLGASTEDAIDIAQRAGARFRYKAIGPESMRVILEWVREEVSKP